MNSVIAGLEFVAPASLEAMTRGQMCLLSSTGNIIPAAANISNEHMYQFIVALGDGKYKRGVWINPKRTTAYLEEFAEPESRVLTFNNITPLINNLYAGEEVALIFSLPPLTSFHAEDTRQYAATTVLMKDDTEANIRARLKTAIDTTVTNINSQFGSGTITINPAVGAPLVNTLTITGVKGLRFDAHFEGFIASTKTSNNANLTPTGTQEQVAKLERNEDVANAGFNPNFIEAYSPYGKIFTSDLADGYNIFTMDSRADRTHQFDINTLGMEVVQWVALDYNADGDLLTEIVTALGGGKLIQY